MLSELSKAHEFMSRKLVTIESHSNVSKAVKLMVDYNIGSIIVMDTTGPTGIFTERDLLRNVLDAGRKMEEPILKEVMTPSLNALDSDSTVVDAARLMSEKKGRLVVLKDGNPVGIITATDIVREIQREGCHFDFTGSYTRGVWEVPPSAKVAEVVHLMARERIGSVIVSKGMYPRGIFTERDLLQSVLTLEFRMGERVENFATHHIVTASEDISGHQAADIMTRYRIKRLPLVRGEEVISGIVTARDLVQAFAESAK